MRGWEPALRVEGEGIVKSGRLFNEKLKAQSVFMENGKHYHDGSSNIQ
jgi:hypothetical protein